MGQILPQVQNVMCALDNAFATGNTAALRATGQMLGQLIGYTTGNLANFSNVSDNLLFLHDTVTEALQRKGRPTKCFLCPFFLLFSFSYRDRPDAVCG